MLFLAEFPKWNERSNVLAGVKLTADDMRELDAVAANVRGERYPEEPQKMVGL